MLDIAIISNEPTPYRLHVLGRIANELEGVQLHSLFTHRRDSGSMPWETQLDESINPRFFKENALVFGHNPSKRCNALFEEIKTYLGTCNVKLAIIHGYNDQTRIKLIRWAKKQGLPMLMTADSNVLAEGRLGLVKHTIKRVFMRWLINQLAGLMPCGTMGEAYFRSYADHDKPVFVMPFEPDYRGIQNVTEQDIIAFRQKHNLSSDRKYLLYCGRLVAVKRVDDLIQAFSKIAEQRPDWDLVIAGSGELELKLTEQAQKLAPGRVHWLGFMQFEDVAKCYRTCHGLVLPSEFEPWALVINEALAAGLPVAASDVVGAARDLVRPGYNGYLFQARNSSSLANVLMQMTEPDTNEQMSSNALAMLDSWQESVDPVKTMRQVIQTILPEALKDSR